MGYRNLTIDELINKRKDIYKDENLLISYIDNKSDSTVILFAYGMITPTEPPKENLQLYTLNDKNVIHVVDLKVSWFNNFTAEFLLDKIKNLIINKKIYLLGMSMGAFNAIHFSNYIDSEICLGFGPQYSVKDPPDNRYGGNMKYYIDRLESFNVHTLNFSKKTKYRIVFGADDEEKLSSYETVKLCKKNNIDAFFIIFNNSPHLVLNYLNQTDGDVDKIIEKFLYFEPKKITDEYSNHSAYFFHASEENVVF